MSAEEFQTGPTRILYDPVVVTAISPEWLYPEFWRIRNAVVGELGGRGQALHIDSPVGPAVLRRYCRGGQVARISRDRYLFTGYQRSRSFVEWWILHRLHWQGLPVPVPILAGCERHGLLYRAALITSLIPESRSLAEVAEDLELSDWKRLVATLRLFFEAGVVHADLNAHNILADHDRRWYVIDFDRARIRKRPADPEPMLKRLFRSFDKLGIDGERKLLWQLAGQD